MTPCYPVRDGHPSMFAPEDSAVAVSGEPISSISPMSGSADGANDTARMIHNARITDDAPQASATANGVYANAPRSTPLACAR